MSERSTSAREGEQKCSNAEKVTFSILEARGLSAHGAYLTASSSFIYPFFPPLFHTLSLTLSSDVASHYALDSYFTVELFKARSFFSFLNAGRGIVCTYLMFPFDRVNQQVL